MKTLAQLAADLADGRVTSRALVEGCLERIEDPTGEGGRTFLKVHAEGARATADLIDGLRARGAAPTAFAGIPISIKDLFDTAGDVTTSGSLALQDAAPARRDATAVVRLKAAGFVPIGRTNMSEFAFSGLGLNIHYGTPRNPFEREVGRIPGGSSSGAAISITDGMAAAALGTDTGGSCRIPAALCGIVGFKPTSSRVPLDGAAPLSTSLDSAGPLGATVACCAALDAILAGDVASDTVRPMPLAGLRLAVPQTLVLAGLDRAVATAFDAALSRLSAAGARISEIRLAELAELATVNAKGGFAAAESYAWHRRLLAAKGELYDPRIRVRVLRGKEQEAADYIDLLNARADLIARLAPLTAPFDALVMPTVPTVAPTLAEVETDEDFGRINLLMLRNPSVANFFDRCAVSVPCHRRGELPVGLMLVGERHGDGRLLAMAAAVEAEISPSNR